MLDPRRGVCNVGSAAEHGGRTDDTRRERHAHGGRFVAALTTGTLQAPSTRARRRRLTTAGAPVRFRACSTDTDCVAVPRVGCCHNGWKEAVAASQKSSLCSVFRFVRIRTPCALMYLIRDAREAKCDPTTRLCTMFTK